MRKLAILAVLAVPVSAFGAFAFAANDGTVSSDSQMIVNETDKGDLAKPDQGTQLLAMEESGESESEAGPIPSKVPDFGEAEGEDHDHDD